MGNYQWTDMQKKAIETKGSDILVSAAAGSGKTAVLTERILRRLTDPYENADITDFLIVTFTVSATAELREKLSSQISDAYQNDKTQKNLKKQLFNLPAAKIVTIDSFCKYVVGECSKDLNLPSDITLGDEGELKALLLDAVTEVTDEIFAGEKLDALYDTSYLPESARADFLTLVETFSSSKSFDSFHDTLMEVYSDLLKSPDPFKKAYLSLNNYDLMLKSHYIYNESTSFFDTFIGKAVIDECKEALEYSLSLLREARLILESFNEMAEKYAPSVDDDIASLIKISMCESRENFIEEISKFAPTSLKSYRCNNEEEVKAQTKFKALRDSAKNALLTVQKKYPIYDQEKLYLQTAKVFSVSSVLFSLIKKIDEKVWAEKLDKKILSFDDIAHLAFKALVKEDSYNHNTREFERTDYAVSLSERFKEIFIDEYQDVNELQDTIFRAVSNNRNRFMVGDVKQSIYKFRGATPEIFMEYRNTFSTETESDFSRLISLQNNFRSDSSVIDFVNTVFERVMNYEDENVYRKDDSLIFSKNSDKKLPTELCLFEKGECDYIAERILEFYNGGEFTLSDICVLATKHSALIKIQEALKKRGIPSDYNPDRNFFESYEIATLISILKVCDNPTDDISLISVLTSSIFMFTPSDLLKIRNNSDESDFYFALQDYKDKNSDDLSHKCRIFLDSLENWKNSSKELTSDALIWKIYEDTHFLSLVKAMNEGEEKKENLITFYNIARNFESREIRGLTKFLSFVENIQKEKRRFNSNSGSKDCVHLLTVHDSKGLEFPVTFFSCAADPISRADERKKVILNNSFTPAFAVTVGKLGGKVSTYALKAMLSQTRSANIDEQLRLLYVALTRAKNKLIITGECKTDKFLSYVECACRNKTSFTYSIKNASSLLNVIGVGLGENETFLTALESSQSQEDEKLSVKIYDIFEGGEEKFIQAQKSEVFYDIPLSKEEISFALKDITDPIMNVTPFKLSVSLIREGLLDESDIKSTNIKRYPDFMSLDSNNLSAFTGTAMHTFMQFCDFENCRDNSTVNEAERLLKYGFITEEQMNVLNHSSLQLFFKSPLYKKIRNSKNVQREKRYTLLVPSSKFFADENTKKHLDSNHKKTLIQGVIDCYFENEDGTFTVLDFKTDNVNKKDGEEILRQRHKNQLMLYKESVEAIESKKVRDVYIYSFCLAKAIKID